MCPRVRGYPGPCVRGHPGTRARGPAKTDEHPDALFAQPVEQVAEKVVAYIRDLKPDVVLTFDPIGGYRHPDHIAIQQATVKAFENANNAD